MSRSCLVCAWCLEWLVALSGLDVGYTAVYFPH